MAISSLQQLVSWMAGRRTGQENCCMSMRRTARNFPKLPTRLRMASKRPLTLPSTP
ncbi:hypothetical protein BDR05DRAFT_971319 [Suillus weaverae]|nr:hypothetical protein BDR05DRAFT_971319 [Suillus weaverae]